MPELSFTGRVAIVTGAGGGLGRTYALELARRGAKVVVNDLGGDAHGNSAASTAADAVVAEIRRGGGVAVPNYDSVEFGERIVQTALDNFGRIDIVINNAGILRDVSFLKMTETDWDLIMKVHVKGAFSVTKAAWPHLRKQKYGRVIFTSSNSGIYGSFGQANYSAAKMALVGLGMSLALEGAKYNIHCNILVPTAGSRLTRTIMPEEMVEAFRPEYVTPLVTYLCHERCQESGRVYEGGAGWYGTVQQYRSKGAVIPDAKAENIETAWQQINDMKNAKHYSNSELMAELTEIVSRHNSKI